MQWRLDPGQLDEERFDEDPRPPAPVQISHAPAIPDVDNYGQVVKHFSKLGMCAVVGAWQFTGGQDRFNHWADTNYDDYAKNFLTKTLPKQVQLEHSGSVTIDDLILGLGDDDVIEGEAREIENAA